MVVRGTVAASLVVVGILAVCAGRAAEEFEGEQQVRAVSQSLLPYFSAAPPPGLDERFSAALAQLTKARGHTFASIFAELHQLHGKAAESRLLRMTGPYTAEVELVFEKGTIVPARISLDTTPPFRITGLIFRDPIRDGESIKDVVAQLQALPGRTACSLIRLGSQPRAVCEWNAERPMAVGSAFKLLVLAALVDECGEGRRQWSDVIQTRSEWSSLPAGVVQDWPAGSPVTLHTLAALMISRSDNTAADHLIRTLGRERVESMQKKVGVKAPDRNVPLLLTQEFFKLKLVLPPFQQRSYLQGDASARRRFLETQLANVSLARHRALGTPQHIETLEWFLSTGDLVRILDWFQRHEQGAKALEVLAINRGLSLDERQWEYVGFKGGAEPGVLNFTLLLKSSKQGWFACSLTWNDPENEVDQARLMTLAQRLLKAAGRESDPTK